MKSISSARLCLLEASKTHDQHSTLVDGIARASLQIRSPEAEPTVILAHPTLHARLSDQARSDAEYRPVAVMDPRKRRLIRKSLLEAWVVMRAIMGLKRNEVLLVTTLLPSAGILVELFKRFFPKRRAVIMLHGELEGLLDPAKQRLGSFGYYMKVWLQIRKRLRSTLELAVIAPFIKEGLLERAEGAIAADMLHLVPIPIERKASPNPAPNVPFRACFVGFDTPNKGFDQFVQLSEEFPGFEFLHIGGGKARRLGTNSEETDLASADDFIKAISSCDCAVFPYSGGYTLAMSAAGTDAIAAGTHILATDRPCFVDLQQAYGEDCVTICANGAEDMRVKLADASWRASVRSYSTASKDGQDDSAYSMLSLSASLESLLDGKAAQGQAS